MPIVASPEQLSLFAKECDECHELLPREAFLPNVGVGDNLQSKCKECVRRLYRAEVERQRQHVQSPQPVQHIARLTPEERERRQKLRNKQWNERRKQERAIQREKRASLTLMERGWKGRQMRLLKYHEFDPDRNRRNHRRWRERNRAWSVWREEQRRARKAAGGSYTLNEWTELCERYGNVCLACGQQKPLTVDHVVPLSKGGLNTIDNLQPLCGPCNSSKQAKIIDYRVGFPSQP